jgi:Zn-dependent protease with chaperone function
MEKFMDRSPSYRLLQITLFLLPLLFCSVGHAEKWLVTQALALKGPVIVLKDNSGVVHDEIQRSWVQHMAAVTQHMAQTYELPVPQMWIVDQGSPNAFVTNDDREILLVANTDILRLIGDDEDLMAAVIGHEFGHLKAGHLTRGHAVKVAVAVAGLILGAATDDRTARKGVDSYGLGRQAGTFGAGLVSAKFNRDQEREADDLGIRNMAKAGYDPSAVPRLWRLMEAQGGSGNGLWLSSHPSNEERLQRMQTVAASLTDIYAANKPARVSIDRTSLPVYRSTGSRIAILGVHMATMSSRAFGVEGVDGAMVTAVAPESVAAAAGIKVGDILLRVNDTPINDPDDVRTAVATADRGSIVEIRLMRNARPVWVNARF